MQKCLISYVELCRPFVLPAPWAFCPTDKCSLFGPPDPAAALTALVERHSSEQLIESGIAQVDGDNRLVLHPFLATADVGIIVLLNSTDDSIRNLMTESGCVLGKKTPVFEVLDDKHTADALDRDESTLLVTETIVDAVLLRSFGLAAVPVVGLERLTQSGIESLCEHFGVKRDLSEREQEEQYVAQLAAQQETHGFESMPDPKDPLLAHRAGAAAPGRSSPNSFGMPPHMASQPGSVREQDENYIRLALVRWTPHSVSDTDPVSMKRVVDELKVLKLFRGLDIYEINQWIPQAEHLETICFALSRGEVGWAKDAILDSVFSGIGSIEHVATKAATVTPPTDLAGAVELLHDAMLGASDDRSRQQRKEALHNYHQVVLRQITKPMVREAASASDPLERAMQLQFVELNSMFLAQAPLVREQVLLGLTQRLDGSKNNGDKSVTELLAISGQLVALAREMTKWKPRSTPVLKPTAPKLNLSRRFADSDLVLQN